MGTIGFLHSYLPKSRIPIYRKLSLLFTDYNYATGPKFGGANIEKK
jgi:hypothetical protein